MGGEEGAMDDEAVMEEQGMMEDEEEERHVNGHTERGYRRVAGGIDDQMIGRSVLPNVLVPKRVLPILHAAATCSTAFC